MTDQEIKIEYFHTEKEYLAATRLYLLSSSNLLIRIGIFCVLLMVGGLMVGIVIEDFPLWAPIAFALLLATSLLYNTLVQAPTKYFRGDAKFRDKHELTASDEGIGIKTPQIDAKIAWTLYTRVVEGKDLFLLMYGKDLPTMTLIPKRAFKNSQQEQEFLNLARRHISHYTRFGHGNSRRIEESSYKPNSLNPPDWR